MIIDKKDLALAAIVKDSKFPLVRIQGDGRSFASDGYLFAEYTSPRRIEKPTEGYLALTEEACATRRKDIPTGFKAVRDELDFVDVKLRTCTDDGCCPDLADDKRISEAIDAAPEFVFSLDPDLLVKANKFLFEGHTKGVGRKQLQVKVFRLCVTIKGAPVTYPVYELTNRNDDTRKVILCGLKEN